mmetsp:Transcript_34464/g.79553  ORF Transcript_34464/g.79553 Transcript_34464/m.79553 type:complete len:274 (+) Transcript_34464:161-982(+)
MWFLCKLTIPLLAEVFAMLLWGCRAHGTSLSLLYLLWFIEGTSPFCPLALPVEEMLSTKPAAREMLSSLLFLFAVGHGRVLCGFLLWGSGQFSLLNANFFKSDLSERPCPTSHRALHNIEQWFLPVIFLILLLTVVLFCKPQGSPATGGCCSKCWRELQKKSGETEVTSEPSPSPSQAEPMDSATTTTSSETAQEQEPTPMEVETPVVKEIETTKAPATAPSSTKKRKKKKASYRNMMAGMMKSSTPSRDIEKEKEGLRKVTGGGAFSKIEKI